MFCAWCMRRPAVLASASPGRMPGGLSAVWWTSTTVPLNRGPRLLFVLVDSPVLRRRLLDALATALSSDGHAVARLDLSMPSYQPLQDIFAMAEAHPQAHFYFLHGLERSLLSPEYSL